jgi:hypothetical protein
MSSFRAALGVVLLIGLPTACRGIENIAVIVGCNQGLATDRRLRYAEADARRMGTVLAELGTYRDDRLYVLTDATVTEFVAKLHEVSGRVKELYHEGKPTRVLIYYSGHGSGEALHMKGKKLAVGTLRDLFAQMKADLKIMIADACYSGALMTRKGGRYSAPVRITIDEKPAVKGTVLITSTSDTEFAHESKHLKGSLFSYHLVSALRGAADYDRDMKVTLWEAYSYARTHTIRHGAFQPDTRQHPEFEIELQGQKNVVFTDLTRAPSSVFLAGCAEGRYTFLGEEGLDAEVDVSVRQGDSVLVALPAGRYLVTHVTAASTRICRLDASWGGSHRIENGDFRRYPHDVLTRKGPGRLRFAPNLLAVRYALCAAVPDGELLVPSMEVAWDYTNGRVGGEVAVSFQEHDDHVVSHGVGVSVHRRSLTLSGELRYSYLNRTRLVGWAGLMPAIMFCAERLRRDDEEAIRALGYTGTASNTARLAGAFATAGVRANLPWRVSVYLRVAGGLWSGYDRDGALHYWPRLPIGIGVGFRL